jgi:hypothetical protein
MVRAIKKARVDDASLEISSSVLISNNHYFRPAMI